MRLKFIIFSWVILIYLISLTMAAQNFTMYSTTNQSFNELFGSVSDSYGFVIDINKTNMYIDGFNKTGEDGSTRGQLRNTLEQNLTECNFASNYCKFSTPFNM